MDKKDKSVKNFISKEEVAKENVKKNKLMESHLIFGFIVGLIIVFGTIWIKLMLSEIKLIQILGNMPESEFTLKLLFFALLGIWLMTILNIHFFPTIIIFLFKKLIKIIDDVKGK